MHRGSFHLHFGSFANVDLLFFVSSDELKPLLEILIRTFQLIVPSNRQPAKTLVKLFVFVDKDFFLSFQQSASRRHYVH